MITASRTVIEVPDSDVKGQHVIVKAEEVPASDEETGEVPVTSPPMKEAASLCAVPQKNVRTARPEDPTVTYLEMLRFFWFSTMVVLVQIWRDIKEGRRFRPILLTELISHYYHLPVIRRDPRVVVSGPYPRMAVRMIPPHVTRLYEESYDLSLVTPTELINCASNNYGGFTQLSLEPGAEKVMEDALQKLPFAPAPAALEPTVLKECAEYMGFDAAATAPSGFSTNVLGFATAAGVAKSLGKKLVFLCDRDCHNSMFTGAFFNKTARTHKFDHSDLTDLEYKLRMYREQDPAAFIVVAVEGIYSMEGSVPPIPAILALKKVYGFSLLVDEAHSFMALGSMGKGSLNYWEDAGFTCPMSEVDLMSAMFSKAVGCTGGMVLANGIFATELRKQAAARDARGVETLSTVVLLRILNLLRKPLLIKYRMRMIREKARYVAEGLRKSGLQVLSSPGAAIVVFPAGTVSQATNFHTHAVSLGLAVTAGGPPATPLWGCRMRFCMAATTTWPDIHRMLTVINIVSQRIRVRGVIPASYDPALLTMTDSVDPAVLEESAAVDARMLRYVDELAGTKSSRRLGDLKEDQLVRNAGVEALRKYGIGPCSARWFYGSFDIFIELERRLASLYPSLLAQSGRCRAMICGDAEITIGSTLTALMSRNCSPGVLNRVLVAANAPLNMVKGATLNRPSEHVSLDFYTDLNDLLSKLTNSSERSHLTIYFETVSNGVTLDLATFLESTAPILVANKPSGITIMLDDRNGLGKIGPRSLGYLSLMEEKHGVDFLKTACDRIGCPVHIIVAGSWFDAFGHQGGYVTGHASVVENLTWDAKAYFFSTPPMPLQAAMSDAMLRMLSKKA
ncbi:a-oxoamine synthase fum8 [Aspergillus filifer]